MSIKLPQGDWAMCETRTYLPGGSTQQAILTTYLQWKHTAGYSNGISAVRCGATASELGKSVNVSQMQYLSYALVHNTGG